MFGPRDVSLNPVEPTAFVSASDAKDYMGVTGDDTLIGSICLAVSASLEGFCNTIFTQRAVTETLYPEEPVTNLVLAHSPAIALSSLTIDGVAQTLSDYTLMKASGMVRQNEGEAISGRKIVVVYTAGYATLPADVLEAAREFIKLVYGAKTRDASVKSESTEGVGAITYRSAAYDAVTGPTGVKVPGEVAAMISRHVRNFGL